MTGLIGLIDIVGNLENISTAEKNALLILMRNLIILGNPGLFSSVIMVNIVLANMYYYAILSKGLLSQMGEPC